MILVFTIVKRRLGLLRNVIWNIYELTWISRGQQLKKRTVLTHFLRMKFQTNWSAYWKQFELNGILSLSTQQVIFLWVNKLTAMGTVKNLILVLMVLILGKIRFHTHKMAEEVVADFQRSQNKGVRKYYQELHMAPNITWRILISDIKGLYRYRIQNNHNFTKIYMNIWLDIGLCLMIVFVIHPEFLKIKSRSLSLKIFHR